MTNCPKCHQETVRLANYLEKFVHLSVPGNEIVEEEGFLTELYVCINCMEWSTVRESYMELHARQLEVWKEIVEKAKSVPIANPFSNPETWDLYEGYSKKRGKS